jgi:HSP20 family protein
MTMSDVMIRKQNGGQLQQTNEIDPFAWARQLLRWDPFRTISPTTYEPATFAPAFEVKESKESYLLRADVPGVKEQDLDVSLVGNRLTVSGKRESEKEEHNDTFYTCERSYGSFMRTFTLPDGIDAEHVKAELKEGVLTIAVPKLPEAQPKKIAISRTEKKS